MSQAGPSQRQLRVGEQLRHAISETLQRGHFHDAALFSHAHGLSVSEVRVSPDLKKATAYVVSLGGGGTDDLIPALNDSAAVFQKEVAHKLNLRFTPRISFVADDSFDSGRRIDDILNSLPETRKS